MTSAKSAPDMDSLSVTDRAAAAVATAPRVTLADIEAAIAAVYHVNGEDAVRQGGIGELAAWGGALVSASTPR